MTAAWGRGAMLIALTTATFLATSTGTAIAPFLLPMAQDLGSDLAALGMLVALGSITWGAASLAAGAASDRLGRRPILVAGLVVLTASRVGLALSADYASAAAWQLVGGIGGGTFMGTVFATVSDAVPLDQRGRALGSVITGQSLSLVLGVPLLTIVGSVGGWRGAILVQGAAMLATAAAVAVIVPGGRTSRTRPHSRRGSVARTITPRLLALLGAGMMERACFAGVAVYFATYLVVSYRIALAGLAPALALVALGNLVGNFLGSHVADRLVERPLVFAVSSVVTAALALPLLLSTPGLVVSVVIGFTYSLANALGRPALLAALSDVPSDVRGAVLGLNVTSASVGWLGATAAGGWLIAQFGFMGLSVFSALAGVVGAALALGSRRLRHRAGAAGARWTTRTPAAFVPLSWGLAGRCPLAR